MKIIFFFLLFFANIQISHAKEKIDVYISHFPPFWITTGENENMGRLQAALPLFAEKLQSYSLTFLDVPFARSLAATQKGKHICHFVLRKSPQREEYLDFSLPYALTLSNGLIVSEETKNILFPYINSKGEINLAKAIEQQGLMLRVAKSRRYSPVLDKIIAANNQNNLIEAIPGKEQIRRVLPTVLKNFVGTLGFPSEMTLAMQKVTNSKELKFIPVQGNAPFTRTYAACTKGEWNNKFISELNHAIKQLRTDARFINIMGKWLPKEQISIHQDFTLQEFQK